MLSAVCIFYFLAIWVSTDNLIFSQPHALEERIAIMYATTLSNQDMLQAMRKTVNKTWEISGELKVHNSPS